MMIRTAALAGLLLLAACSGKPERAAVQAPAVPTPPADKTEPARAAEAPLMAVPLPSLPHAETALASFRRSCAALLRREDLSGLTKAADWQPACAAAIDVAPGQTAAEAFFRAQFRGISVAGGTGFATGYYEPEIAANLTRQPGYDVPLYRRPPDLIDVPLGSFAASLKGRTIRGRVDGTRLVPYAARADIDAALAGRGLELAWAADPFEAFFLEIQGSGRLRLPDGRIMRIGYDGQNGRDYRAIGRLLIEQGRLERGKAGMKEILAWLRANPADAPAVLNANPSKIFFRELTGDGPIGAMGVAVVGGTSVAADPAYIPLGAPLLLDTIRSLDGTAITALMVAQDTGGAIKGPNRVDMFLGAGETAAAQAGAQAAPARLILLLPISAAARLIP